MTRWHVIFSGRVQRMVMATASAAYAVMKQIVDHSFQGITYGQMNMEIGRAHV